MMITLEILQTTNNPTETEVARYVGEMAGELANMARALGANDLVAMLEMARTEAERLIEDRGQRPAAATAPSRSH
jgi:hypothetical protein